MRRPRSPSSSAAIIVRQCEQLHEALAHLRGFKGLDATASRSTASRTRATGSAARRSPTSSRCGDPIHIIKWRKVYNVLEETIDLAEDVADIIERITLKNS